ncbi:L-threonylcarbamoyladenylate synthase [Mycoplasmopsis felifaucium]|uniref:L-threonylcarbamoyladenylate synthase n=1 Tax=Mycoplasmopsis felifaucium TaxID=35768 RepID=A0ABZ2RS67_9BACT
MDFKDIFICTTDTVTGIGGPICQNTLDCIYFLKKRPLNKKIMILVGSIDQAKKFKEFNNEAVKFAEKYWPGAFSVIVNGQGFRMPNNEQLLEYLINNGPMYVTSANISGEPPIKISDASKTFPNVKKIFDFGPTGTSPSQIYNLDTKEWIR